MATHASQRDGDVERQLQIQYDVSGALAESDGITEAAPRVLAALGRHLGWPVGIFWLVDELDGVLRPEAVLGGSSAHGEFLRGASNTVFERGSGLPGRVWESGASAWISDIDDLTAYPRQQLARRSGLHAALAFPLIASGRVLGVLEFYATTVLHPGDALLRSVAGVCNQVAQFVAHMRDLGETHRSSDEQRLLVDAGAVLASSLDYQATLRNLSRVVIPAFADWYVVDVVDDEDRLVRLTVEHRDPAKIAAARELAEHLAVGAERRYGAESVVRSGEPQLVPDISDRMLAAVVHDDEQLRLVRALGLRSFIVVPMRTSERVVGAITFVAAESGRRYDDRDLRLAEELARRAAQAIENARLFGELRETREALEEQAAELESQSDELQRTTRELEATIEDLQDANEELVKRTYDAERARAEAEKARREADQANRAKSEFLATMSHELRTPLNAIVGYAQLLEVGVHGVLSRDQAVDVARILRSAHHLLGLINDLLNFAKVEAGQLQLRIRDIEVSEVIEEVEDLVRPQSRQKRLAYTFDNQCPGARVCADRDKLAQVFANLLTNAIQFTPAGGSIAVVCTADEKWVSTEIRDTGIGIAANKLEAIFEPFVQLAMQYSGDRQGTGLGLAITRELVRAMGGDVSVRSEPGTGSAFTVRLPRA